jgi:hypothetical protein
VTPALSLLEAALTLADHGHPVLPLHTPQRDGCSCGRRCGKPGKHPFGGYGLSRASVDTDQIEAWWEERPDANVGMRCDGLLVVDVDSDDGARSLAALEEELGPLPETWRQTTGRGQHLVYAADVGGNSTQPLGSPPSLHLRAGRRGYIVAAPSRHASGGRYTRLGPATPAPLPEAWLERLRRPATPDTATPTEPPYAGMSSYGRAALRGESDRLLRAQCGARNDTLNLVTFRLAQLVAGGELALEDLEAAVRGHALRIGREPLEVTMTMRYAVRAGLRHPRGRR